jgi:hypothetical protein
MLPISFKNSIANFGSPDTNRSATFDFGGFNDLRMHPFCRF